MWAVSKEFAEALSGASTCMAGCNRPVGHMCGRYFPGDAEPLDGERLSSWVVHWERCDDGKWRPVNAPGSDSAYSWDELVNGFKELTLVTKR